MSSSIIFWFIVVLMPLSRALNNGAMDDPDCKAAKPATSNREGQASNPFAKLNRFFESDPL